MRILADPRHAEVFEAVAKAAKPIAVVAHRARIAGGVVIAERYTLIAARPARSPSPGPSTPNAAVGPAVPQGLPGAHPASGEPSRDRRQPGRLARLVLYVGESPLRMLSSRMV